MNIFKKLINDYNELDKLLQNIGNDKVELIKRLSTESTLSITQSVDVLKFYDYDINKCFDLCKYSALIGKDTYSAFLSLKNIIKR